jgi:hypothetical protein
MIHVARLHAFINFIRTDPLFVPRFLLYGLHPRAMLPTTFHVHRLLFSPEYPNDKLEDFTRYLPESEAFIWVLGLIPEFTDFRIVVQWSIVGLKGGAPDRERILILAGELDVMMDVRMMHRLARRYRDAVRHMMGENAEGHVSSDVGYEAGREEAYTEDRRDGVRMVVVKGAGHHVQNDLQWEVGAQRVVDFLQQL